MFPIFLFKTVYDLNQHSQELATVLAGMLRGEAPHHISLLYDLPMLGYGKDPDLPEDKNNTTLLIPSDSEVINTQSYFYRLQYVSNYLVSNTKKMFHEKVSYHVVTFTQLLSSMHRSLLNSVIKKIFFFPYIHCITPQLARLQLILRQFDCKSW